METVIYQIRKKMYSTQGEFARAANLRQSEISQIENGLMKLGPTRRARVAEALDVDDEKILFLDNGFPRIR